MNEQKMKAAWSLLQFRVKPHSEQTERFTRQLSDTRVPGEMMKMGFTKQELVNMSPVISETISAMRDFLPMIPAKNQTEFRRQLAYLTELRDLQAEAWQEREAALDKKTAVYATALKMHEDNVAPDFIRSYLLENFVSWE